MSRSLCDKQQREQTSKVVAGGFTVKVNENKQVLIVLLSISFIICFVVQRIISLRRFFEYHKHGCFVCVFSKRRLLKL